MLTADYHWNELGISSQEGAMQDVTQTSAQQLRSSLSTAAAASIQSCPTLCNPIDGSQPGFPSLGFSRQEHWSGLPLPSPMHESEK